MTIPTPRIHPNEGLLIGAVVLLQNGEEEETSGKKVHKIDPGTAFIGPDERYHTRTIQAFDDEGDGEREEQEVSCALPELEKEDAGHNGAGGDNSY